MNPYVANIVGALTGSNDGLMSFTPTDFPVGGMNPASVNNIPREPLPQATVEPAQIVSNDVQPQEARKPNIVNPARQSQDMGKGVNAEVDEGFKGSGLTSYQIEKYMKGSADILKAGQSFANGYLAYSSGIMRGKSLEFEAKQHERNAELLYKNMREINRAADADANVYRVQGAGTKSAQKVAMAASGFAVGKGIYKTTMYSTDVRTEYNVALLKLKAGLQNAEILRQIGVENAQAEIKKGEASIARKLGRAKYNSGIADAVAYSVSAGSNFYMGYKGEGATTGGK